VKDNEGYVNHHRWALLTIIAAVVIDSVGAWAFAMADHVSIGLAFYWAVYTATTVGYGDVPVVGAGAHAVAVVVMLSAIPLWTATFSLFTAGLLSVNVKHAEKRVRAHVTSEHERTRQGTPET
jgi:voltage-gated potassium channel